MWKRILIVALGLLLLDILLWWLIFYKPVFLHWADGLTVLAIMFMTSLPFFIVGVIILLFWKPAYGITLITNSIAIFFIFIGMNTLDKRKMEYIWEFTVNDELYEIRRMVFILPKNHPFYDPYTPNKYSLDKVFNKNVRHQMLEFDAPVWERNDTLFFTRSDSTTFYMHNGVIHNFQGANNIKVTEVSY